MAKKNGAKGQSKVNTGGGGESASSGGKEGGSPGSKGNGGGGRAGPKVASKSAGGKVGESDSQGSGSDGRAGATVGSKTGDGPGSKGGGGDGGGGPGNACKASGSKKVEKDGNDAGGGKASAKAGTKTGRVKSKVVKKGSGSGGGGVGGENGADTKNGSGGGNGTGEVVGQPAVQVIVSAHTVAQVFGVSIRAVQQWVKEKAMPKGTKNKYDLAAIVAWREGRIRAELSKDTKDAQRYDKAAADQKEAQAAMAEMDRKKREGELLEKSEVQRGLIESIIAVKTALTSLAIGLSKQLFGVDDEYKISEIVAGEVDQVLQRFADRDELTEAAATVAAQIGPAVAAKLADKKLITKTKFDAVEKEIVKVICEELK